MTILIVDALAANEGRRKFSRDAIGVGPRLLAGVCEKHSKDVRVIRVEDLLENKHSLESNDWDIFLISGMSVDEIAISRAIKQIQNNNPQASILLGGPIVSDNKIIKKLRVNAGVIGEGEIILEELLRRDFSYENLAASCSKDIEYRRIGDSWLFKQRELSSDSVFTDYPASTKRIVDYPDHWFSKVYVEITRGCSNHFRGEIVKSLGGCSNCGNCENPDTVSTADCPEDIPPGCGFCSVPATFGPPRNKEQELIVKEIRELFNQGVRRIILSSPGFFDYFRGKNNEPIYSPTKPPANLEKISELLNKLASLRDEQSELCSIAIENVKPSLVTEDGAKIIGRTLPKTAISIGCETFDVNHSSAIGRPSSSDQALEAARLFKKEGIDPQIYLIHSLPGETAESLQITREVVNGKLKDYAEKITVYKYLPLPNSPFTVTNSPLPAGRLLLKELREKLKQDIIDFNKTKKEELIGRQIELIVAEKDLNHRNYYFSYPIYSGPSTTVFSEENIIGSTILAEISEVITDRLVKAEIVKRLN